MSLIRHDYFHALVVWFSFSCMGGLRINRVVMIALWTDCAHVANLSWSLSSSSRSDILRMNRLAMSIVSWAGFSHVFLKSIIKY